MDRVPDEGISPMLDDLETHIYDNGIGKWYDTFNIQLNFCPVYI